MASSRRGFASEIYVESIVSPVVVKIPGCEAGSPIGFLKTGIHLISPFQVIGYQYSRISLLIHFSRALFCHQVVGFLIMGSNVRSRAFFNIEVHLPLASPFNWCIEVNLNRYSILPAVALCQSWVSPAKF